VQFFFWDGNGTVHKRFRQSAMGQYRYRRKTMSFIRDGTVALPSPKKCAVFFLGRYRYRLPRSVQFFFWDGIVTVLQEVCTVFFGTVSLPSSKKCALFFLGRYRCRPPKSVQFLFRDGIVTVLKNNVPLGNRWSFLNNVAQCFKSVTLWS